MRNRKRYNALQAARTGELLTLLDDQTRTRAVDNEWDLARAAAQIDTILESDPDVLALAYSAYLFDSHNPTALQLSQRWTLVWERVRSFRFVRRIRRARPTHSKTPHKGTRLPFAPWRTPTAIAIPAAGGVGYLALTQPPAIYFPAAFGVALTYAIIETPRINSKLKKDAERLNVSDREWSAITKAVAHQRFNRIKPATLDVGIDPKNSVDSVAEALAAKAKIQTPPHRQKLPGLLKVGEGKPIPWRFTSTDSRTIAPRTAEHTEIDAQLDQDEASLRELAKLIFDDHVQILDVQHNEKRSIEKFKVRFDARTAERWRSKREQSRAQNDWVRLYPAGNRLQFTWDLQIYELTVQTVASPAQSITEGAGAPGSDPRKATERTRRVAGVHAALAQLDQEWMDYERDWHAWTLAQPLLHVPEVPQTAAYNDALYELREITYTLADTASETEIVAGEKAADTALRAWDIAQDHAAAIGIADRSPLEQRTLRRLHHLVGQLADPSTPKPMWQQLITQIDRQLKNLETVQISWSQIQLLPALEASPRIQAIQQFAEVPNA